MQQTTATKLAAPRWEDHPALLIGGLREHYTAQSVNDIGNQWQRLAPYFGRIPGQVGRAAYGLVLGRQNGVDGFDYLAGVEVADGASLPAGFTTVELPSLRYAVFDHHEHVSKLKDTMSAIWRHWLPASGHEPAGEKGSGDGPGMVEFYGEEFDPQTGLGGIEVWLPVKAAWGE